MVPVAIMIRPSAVFRLRNINPSVLLAKMPASLIQVSVFRQSFAYSVNLNHSFRPHDPAGQSPLKERAMGRFDPNSPYRPQAEPAHQKAVETDHCRRATPLMGPLDETLDRLLGRTEAELDSPDLRRRRSFLAHIRAIYAGRRPDFTR